MLMAYRYILCTFLDEAVMGTPWGANTCWAEHSMLSRFHNETWGGEKVFTILSRLENEPRDTGRYWCLFIIVCAWVLKANIESLMEVMHSEKKLLKGYMTNY